MGLISPYCLQTNQKKYRPSWDSNPGLLGEKRVCYLCAMPSPLRRKLKTPKTAETNRSDLSRQDKRQPTEKFRSQILFRADFFRFFRVPDFFISSPQHQVKNFFDFRFLEPSLNIFSLWTETKELRFSCFSKFKLIRFQDFTLNG